jgi:hypothetical protein
VPTLSQLWNPCDSPSVQIRTLADMHRPDEPLDMGKLEWSIRMPFEAACYRIDSEYCEPGILRSLAHHLRTTAVYLRDIHVAHRRDVLGVSDAKAAKIGRARQAESKAITKQTSEGRLREKRASPGVGWGLPDEIQLY